MVEEDDEEEEEEEEKGEVSEEDDMEMLRKRNIKREDERQGNYPVG